MTTRETDDVASPPLVALRGVSKRYPSPAGACTALDAIDLSIARGEFVAIVGASGSGKSTLLNLLGGIDRASAGEIEVGGHRLDAMREADLSRWRSHAVGFVFQFFQLLPTLTVLENVMLPMDLGRRWPAREREPRARALLDRLGIADQAAKLPATLSGGQQQRAAVARALANEPALVLADEPTGNLDSRNAAALLELLSDVAQQGRTVVLVTHERALLPASARPVAIADGRIVAAAAA
ncbi:MAG TPA: ABC transporter ATP-binding protein [Xanthomonadales bacterium]|nr:ABC transporter ATP-binding protein [Xanthomonadales bacterium]